MTRLTTNTTPPVPLDRRAALVGSRVSIGYGDLWFDVVVLQHQRVFGRDEWRVTPVAGHGETWVRNVALDTKAARKKKA